MKKITENTILKQGEKEFKAVMYNDLIYWVDENVSEEGFCFMPMYKKGIKVGVETRYFNSDYFTGYGYDFTEHSRIIAQSEPILEEVAVVRLKDSTTQSIMEGEIPFNLIVYTQSDIARAIVLARKGIIGRSDETFYGSIDNLLDVSYILNQINQIQSITVDENFNILSYE